MAPLVRIAIAAGCGAVAANSLGAFYVESLVASGQGLGAAGLLLSWCSVGGLISRFVGGWYADVRPGDPLRSAGRMIALGTVGILGLAYLHGTVWIVLASVLSFSAGWGWPGLLQLGVVRDHMDAPGAASGIAHAGALVGGLVGPVAFGWMAGAHGYQLAWTVTSLVALAGGFLLLWERHRAGRTTQTPALPTTPQE
jgi:MFS family permease